MLLDVFDLGRQDELSYPAALRLMLKAILVSPQFLFITPADEFDTEDQIIPLDDYQLASRLSYLLWATMPDDELMRLADSGKLHEPMILNSQVKRMLETPCFMKPCLTVSVAQWAWSGGFGQQDIRSLQVPRDDGSDARGNVRRSASVLREYLTGEPKSRSFYR